MNDSGAMHGGRAVPPTQGATRRPFVTACIPWMVRVPVVLDVSSMLFTAVLFAYVAVSEAGSMGRAASESVLTTLMIVLPQLPVAALALVVLFFQWRYSRIAAGLVALAWMLALLLRVGHPGATWLLVVPLAGRLVLAGVALTGTFLHHAEKVRATQQAAGQT